MANSLKAHASSVICSVQIASATVGSMAKRAERLTAKKEAEKLAISAKNQLQNAAMPWPSATYRGPTPTHRLPTHRLPRNTPKLHHSKTAAEITSPQKKQLKPQIDTDVHGAAEPQPNHHGLRGSHGYLDQKFVEMREIRSQILRAACEQLRRLQYRSESIAKNVDLTPSARDSRDSRP